MAVSGSQKTRIGGAISGTGIKQTFSPKSPSVVTETAWTPINEGQTASWSEISEAQSSSWVEIVET